MKYFSVFLLIMLSSLSVFTRTEWIRVQSDNGEFSIETPADYTYFYDKEGFDYSDIDQSFLFQKMHILSASTERTVMSVEIYDVPSPKNYMARLLDRQKFNGSTKRDFKQSEFSVREFERNELSDKGDISISHITRFIASKTHLYIVTVANRGPRSSSFDRVLSSIRLGSSQSSPSATDKIVNISSKKPVTINDIFVDRTSEPRPKRTEPQNSKSGTQDPAAVVILSRPFAAYTPQARNNRSGGNLLMRLTFEKNGSISKIEFFKGLPDGLTRSGFFAALRIKFIPSETDGELRTVTKHVEYSFSIN